MDVVDQTVRVGCRCGMPDKWGYVHGKKNCIPGVTGEIEGIVVEGEVLGGVLGGRVIGEVSGSPLGMVRELVIGGVEGRVVPHVRGDVRAVSMGRRKSGVLVGVRYIVSYRGIEDGAGVVFEAGLVGRRVNEGGEEVLEFDNGVRVIDELDRFRFQRA